MTAIGTPSSGPRASPRARRASDAAAWASAPSRSTWRKAWTSPSTAAMRSRWAWVSSTRGDLAVGEGRRPGRRRCCDVGGRSSASSPRIRGTEKRCSSTAGAPDSASSAVRPGTTTSSRKTLVSGSACDVGGTSSPATPLMEATDSRITLSWGARWSSSASERSMRARVARCATSLAGDLGHGVNPRESRPRPGSRAAVSSSSASRPPCRCRCRRGRGRCRSPCRRRGGRARPSRSSRRRRRGRRSSRGSRGRR